MKVPCLAAAMKTNKTKTMYLSPALQVPGILKLYRDVTQNNYTIK
jgi:hypothetical protein